MFQFGGFPTQYYVFILCSMILHHSGFPIRKSAGKRLFAANRSLSQLVTSFVGSWCQGIHPVLFIAWTFSCSLLLELSFDNRLKFVKLHNENSIVRFFIPPFGETVVSQLYRKTCIFFHFICMISIWFCHHFYMLTICSFYSSFALFSFQWSKKLLSFPGGLKWTRTTDLALIRRAL